jgi:hypothetical protein
MNKPSDVLWGPSVGSVSYKIGFRVTTLTPIVTVMKITLTFIWCIEPLLESVSNCLMNIFWITQYLAVIRRYHVEIYAGLVSPSCHLSQ